MTCPWLPRQRVRDPWPPSPRVIRKIVNCKVQEESTNLLAVREEALEDALRLPFGCVGKVDPNIHASGTRQGGIKAFDMVRRCEEEPVLQINFASEDVN